MEFSPFHKDILVDMNLWLADCPCPVVCRVIDDEVDVRYLMSISRVCDHNPYVVIDIKTLVEITTKNKKELYAVELFDALETLCGENDDSDYMSKAEQFDKARKALTKARGVK